MKIKHFKRRESFYLEYQISDKNINSVNIWLIELLNFLQINLSIEKCEWFIINTYADNSVLSLVFKGVVPFLLSWH